MKISFLCSDEKHPMNEWLKQWIEKNSCSHHFELVRTKKELSGGDILFLISCFEIIDMVDRAAYRASLVLHASDLPRGRGWSPHIWQLIEGAQEITISLLEAEDKVDSGRIWKQIRFSVPHHALWDEINRQLFEAQIELVDFAVRELNHIQPYEQDCSIMPTYYPRRIPADSQIDPSQNIANQFNKIRICDPNRYPAFFVLHGKKYKLILEKMDD